jgi:hypothetical protein
LSTHLSYERRSSGRTKRSENYHTGPAIFANFNPEMTDASYKEKFPYVITREVIVRNVTTFSGRALRISDITFMFKKVKVEVK